MSHMSNMFHSLRVKYDNYKGLDRHKSDLIMILLLLFKYGTQKLCFLEKYELFFSIDI